MGRRQKRERGKEQYSFQTEDCRRNKLFPDRTGRSFRGHWLFSDQKQHQYRTDKLQARKEIVGYLYKHVTEKKGKNNRRIRISKSQRTKLRRKTYSMQRRKSHFNHLSYKTI
jgi:recombinational DNA repair protein (RecF pathway)